MPLLGDFLIKNQTRRDSHSTNCYFCNFVGDFLTDFFIEFSARLLGHSSVRKSKNTKSLKIINFARKSKNIFALKDFR